MPLFDFNPDAAFSPAAFYQELEILESTSRGLGERGAREVSPELADQFVVFQIRPDNDGQTIAEASQVEPHFEGSPEQPDMYMTVELQSFHLARSERVDRNSRATMRLVIGKDKNSRDRLFDDIFWTISAGLDLYNQIRNEKARPDEYRADFTKAFGDRPIEIPGSLANMSFEVVKHRDPQWWERIFGFLRSDAGRSLISVVGFPGVTHAAIQVLDELFTRLNRSEPEPLFRSRSMILALSRQAKTDYTAGNPRIRMGCLNPGFCLLARGRDYHAIANADAYYYPHYGKLVPSSVDPGDVVAQNYDDPFADITYAVFKIGMSPTRLALRFNYGEVVV